MLGRLLGACCPPAPCCYLCICQPGCWIPSPSWGALSLPGLEGLTSGTLRWGHEPGLVCAELRAGPG